MNSFYAMALAIAALAACQTAEHARDVLELAGGTEMSATATVSGDTALSFSFPALNAAEAGSARNLWSTNYYTPVYSAATATTSDAVPLLDREDRPLTPPLARENWCNIAMQGTAMIRTSDGSATAYTILDWNGPEQTNCDDRFGRLDPSIRLRSRKSRYQPVSHAYGCGVEGMPLIPFRTIAVDATVIPYRTVLFIPSLRGLSFELEGKALVHDGYVLAGDTGSAIKAAHIDFFSANQRSNPFPTVIRSNETQTFETYVVPADNIAARELLRLHSAHC